MCLRLQWTNCIFVDVSVFPVSFAYMFHTHAMFQLCIAYQLAVKALIFECVFLFMCRSDLLDRVLFNGFASKALSGAAVLTVIRILRADGGFVVGWDWHAGLCICCRTVYLLQTVSDR